MGSCHGKSSIHVDPGNGNIDNQNLPKDNNNDLIVTQHTDKYFGNNDIMFIISSNLPGEYVLRVIPLLCKATQSLRLSLSLLGAPALLPKSRISRKEYYELEGPIYGIDSTWLDLQRVVNRGHSITALKLGDDVICLDRLLPFTVTFPLVKRLSLGDISYFSFSFNRFPSLKVLKIEVKDGETLLGVTKYVVEAVWNIPLLSLALNCEKDFQWRANTIFHFNHPPAFAHSLDSLETCSTALLNTLSPYCRELKHLATSFAHEIITNNPRLTSLTLFSPPEYPLHGLTDLTLLTELVTLNLIDWPQFISNAVHSHLEHVSLTLLRRSTHPTSACQFFSAQSCPTLKHLSIESSVWHDHILSIISSLPPTNSNSNSDDNKYNYQLTVNMPANFPSFAEVEVILQRGFRINEEFLFKATKQESYERIMGVIPHVKSEWKILAGDEELDIFVRQPFFFKSFSSLLMVDIGFLTCDQELILSLLQACPFLKEFNCSWEYLSGGLEINSPSLCKLSLKNRNPTIYCCPAFELPKLTHLTLSGFMGTFLRDLRDHLPLVRVLSIIDIRRSLFVDAWRGHGSLTHLLLSGQCGAEYCDISLQNVPCLRNLTIDRVAKMVNLQLDVPGECDISLQCAPNARSSTPTTVFTRMYRDRTKNYIVKLRYSPGSDDIYKSK